MLSKLCNNLTPRLFGQDFAGGLGASQQWEVVSHSSHVTAYGLCKRVNPALSSSVVSCLSA